MIHNHNHNHTHNRKHSHNHNHQYQRGQRVQMLSPRWSQDGTANATATAAPPISSPSGTSVTPYLTQLQKSLQTGYNLPQPGTSIYTLSQLSNLEFVQKQLSVKQFLEKNFGRKVENNVEVQGQSQSKTSLKRSRDDNDHEQEKDDENSPTSSKKPKTEGETITENTEVFVNDSDEEIDVIKCDEEGSKIRSFSIDSIISR